MAKTFEIIYQAAGAGTGKTVQVDVFDETKTLVPTQSGVATEIGTTGRYHFSFDADAPDWSCQISDNAGGKAIRHFGRLWWEVHGIAFAVADVQTGVDAANAALTALDTALGVTDGKVDGLVTGQAGISTDVAALGTQLTSIENKVNGLTAPPMVG